MIKDNYALGIDAGGTYTDVVILENASGRIVDIQKTQTTYPDLSEGIRRAIDDLDSNLMKSISLVSLATTLATNAIVEERGAEAGLILAGYEAAPREIPPQTKVIQISGGHTANGSERVPLDLKSLESKIGDFFKGLDAVAVASFFSTRNPNHEMEIARFIREHSNLPVVRGHRLSMRLDALKRATTAWWNARLIPLINNLILATQNVLDSKRVVAPLMVVRGDGTLMSGKTALGRPVDTLLSGPAASILGGQHLSGLQDALIVDMGGTTTDMAILNQGKVAVDEQGATVGKWRTHVQAAKVTTLGLGGDSLISSKGESSVVVGPRRVIPLCVQAETCQELEASLEYLLNSGQMFGGTKLNPCVFYQTRKTYENASYTTQPEYLQNGLVNEYLLHIESGRVQASWELDRLEQKGQVKRIGLTPTDIRVASGRVALGKQRAARLGVALFSIFLGISRLELEKRVEDAIGKRLCSEAISLVGGEKDQPLTQLAHRWFKQQGSGSVHGVDLKVDVALTAPVIATGAPAASCLPQAFERLQAECMLPENHHVSVAVGAVVGMVEHTFSGVIRKNDSGRYNLHTELGKDTFANKEAAIDNGRSLLQELAWEKMRQDHVADPVFRFQAKDKKATIQTGEDLLLETKLTLWASGRPNVGKIRCLSANPIEVEASLEDSCYISS